MSLSNTYILYLGLLNALLTTGLISIREIVFSDIGPWVWTGVAIALLFLYEIGTILIIGKKSQTITPRQSVNLFLGLKVGRIILSLLFVVVYAIVIKVELKRFVLVFVAIYFLYLLFDTIYMAKREKEKRKNKS